MDQLWYRFQDLWTNHFWAITVESQISPEFGPWDFNTEWNTCGGIIPSLVTWPYGSPIMGLDVVAHCLLGQRNVRDPRLQMKVDVWRLGTGEQMRLKLPTNVLPPRCTGSGGGYLSCEHELNHPFWAERWYEVEVDKYLYGAPVHTGTNICRYSPNALLQSEQQYFLGIMWFFKAKFSKINFLWVWHCLPKLFWTFFR